MGVSWHDTALRDLIGSLHILTLYHCLVDDRPEGRLMQDWCLADVNLALPDLVGVLRDIDGEGAAVHLGGDLGHVSALW